MSRTVIQLTAVATSALFGGTLLSALFGTLWLGSGYYALARDERFAHPLHDLLSAGGPGGIALGLLGTALMIAMQLYTVRKAMTRTQWLGPLSAWLRFHIACGVMGPLFILLHGGLTFPRGLIALGFWCMVLVALSGGFGRYVFSFFPRTARGRMVEYGAALEQIADLKAELVERTAEARGDSIAQAVELATDLEMEVESVGDLLRLRAEIRRRRKLVDSCLHEADLDRKTRVSARQILYSQLEMKQGLKSWQVAGRLLRYWHLFHRPLAGAMYTIIALHVASAVIFGGSLSQLPRLWE